MATSSAVAPSPRRRHCRLSAERGMDRMDDFIVVLNDILFDRVSDNDPSISESVSATDSDKAARLKEHDRQKHSFGMVVLLKAIQYLSNQDTWDEEARKILVKYYYEAVGKVRMIETVDELVKEQDRKVLDVKVPDVIGNVEEFSDALEEIPSLADVELKACEEKKD